MKTEDYERGRIQECKQEVIAKSKQLLYFFFLFKNQKYGYGTISQTSFSRDSTEFLNQNISIMK